MTAPAVATESTSTACSAPLISTPNTPKTADRPVKIAPQKVLDMSKDVPSDVVIVRMARMRTGDAICSNAARMSCAASTGSWFRVPRCNSTQSGSGRSRAIVCRVGTVSARRVRAARRRWRRERAARERAFVIGRSPWQGVNRLGAAAPVPCVRPATSLRGSAAGRHRSPDRGVECALKGCKTADFHAFYAFCEGGSAPSRDEVVLYAFCVYRLLACPRQCISR